MRSLDHSNVVRDAMCDLSRVSDNAKYLRVAGAADAIANGDALHRKWAARSLAYFATTQGVLIAGAALFVVLAFASFWQEKLEANAISITIFEPAPTIDSLNEEYNLTFAVRNSASIPIRIIGANDRCGAAGCSRTLELPFTVPPRQTRTLHVVFKVGSEGKVNFPLTMYTDFPGQPEAVIVIRGNAAPVRAS